MTLKELAERIAYDPADTRAVTDPRVVALALAEAARRLGACWGSGREFHTLTEVIRKARDRKSIRGWAVRVELRRVLAEYLPEDRREPVFQRTLGELSFLYPTELRAAWADTGVPTTEQVQ